MFKRFSSLVGFGSRDDDDNDNNMDDYLNTPWFQSTKKKAKVTPKRVSVAQRIAQSASSDSSDSSSISSDSSKGRHNKNDDNNREGPETDDNGNDNDNNNNNEDIIRTPITAMPKYERNTYTKLQIRICNIQKEVIDINNELQKLTIADSSGSRALVLVELDKHHKTNPNGGRRIKNTFDLDPPGTGTKIIITSGKIVTESDIQFRNNMLAAAAIGARDGGLQAQPSSPNKPPRLQPTLTLIDSKGQVDSYLKERNARRSRGKHTKHVNAMPIHTNQFKDGLE